MVLVLFFLFITVLVSFLIFLILLSTLRIDIQKLNIVTNTNKKDKFEKDLLIYIGVYFWGKWKLLQIKIDDTRIEKMKLKEKIKKIDIQKLKKEELINIDTLKILKKIPMDVEKFYLKLNLGTIDLNLTTIINFIIILIVSMILPRIIKMYNPKKHYYEIKPIYTNENMVKLDFSCIFNIKMVHIIDILYLVLKKGRVNKDERTSNRRAYDYSYE